MTPVVMDCTRCKKVCHCRAPELQPCSPIGHLQPNLRTGYPSTSQSPPPNSPRPLPPERGGRGGVGLGWRLLGNRQTNKPGMGIPGRVTAAGTETLSRRQSRRATTTRWRRSRTEWYQRTARRTCPLPPWSQPPGNARKYHSDLREPRGNRDQRDYSFRAPLGTHIPSPHTRPRPPVPYGDGGAGGGWGIGEEDSRNGKPTASNQAGQIMKHSRPKLGATGRGAG